MSRIKRVCNTPTSSSPTQERLTSPPTEPLVYTSHSTINANCPEVDFVSTPTTEDVNPVLLIMSSQIRDQGAVTKRKSIQQGTSKVMSRSKSESKSSRKRPVKCHGRILDVPVFLLPYPPSPSNHPSIAYNLHTTSADTTVDNDTKHAKQLTSSQHSQGALLGPSNPIKERAPSARLLNSGGDFFRDTFQAL